MSASPSPAGTTHVAVVVVTPSAVSTLVVSGSTGVAIATAFVASTVALPVTYCASVRASSAAAIFASAALGTYPTDAFSASPFATSVSYVASAAASAASASSNAVASACATKRHVSAPLGAPVAVTVTAVPPSALAHVGVADAILPTTVMVPTGGVGGGDGRSGGG